MRPAFNSLVTIRASELRGATREVGRGKVRKTVPEFVDLKKLPRRTAIEYLGLMLQRWRTTLQQSHPSHKAADDLAEEWKEWDLNWRGLADEVRDLGELFRQTLRQAVPVDKRLERVRSQYMRVKESVMSLKRELPDLMTALDSQMNVVQKAPLKPVIPPPQPGDALADLVKLLETHDAVYLWTRFDTLLIQTGTYEMNACGTFGDAETEKSMREDFGDDGADYTVGPYMVALYANTFTDEQHGYRAFSVATLIQDLDADGQPVDDLRPYWGHPHVSNGSMCTGDTGPAITKALNQHRYLDAVTLVEAVLAGYDPEGCHGGMGLPRYKPSLHPYTNGGYTSVVDERSEDEDGDGDYQCSSCDSYVDEDDTSSCNCCSSVICSDCQYCCDDCSETVCSGCSALCPGCSNRNLCRPRRSSHGDPCGNHCSNCDQYVCWSCFPEGTEYCRVCLDNGAGSADDEDEDEEAEVESGEEIETTYSETLVSIEADEDEPEPNRWEPDRQLAVWLD